LRLSPDDEAQVALQMSRLSHEELQVVVLVQEELQETRGDLSTAALMRTMLGLLAEGVHVQVRKRLSIVFHAW
jgi:hypothetical protein